MKTSRAQPFSRAGSRWVRLPSGGRLPDWLKNPGLIRLSPDGCELVEWHPKGSVLGNAAYYWVSRLIHPGYFGGKMAQWR